MLSPGEAQLADTSDINKTNMSHYIYQVITAISKAVNSYICSSAMRWQEQKASLMLGEEAGLGSAVKAFKQLRYH